MKRSDINQLLRDATHAFTTHGWTLPPNPRWDVTDFGLGRWQQNALVLVNLAEETEYCEKLMYAKAGMTTPAHCHHRKKEDIISRWGTLRVKLWAAHPDQCDNQSLQVKVNGQFQTVTSGSHIDLLSGSRVTLTPGIYHEFFPLTDECIIGEVSTANDDLHDNFFVNPDIGRYPQIDEDEPALVRLLSDHDL